MIYLDLFLGFLRVGLFSFGGAYSAIPLIRDVVMQYGWLTDNELSYMIAVSESTPGPIMVNLATYVGSNQGGVLGAIIATLAVILPAFCIILIVAKIMQKFLSNKYVKAVMSGLIPCIIAIILAVGVVMEAKSLASFSPSFSVDVRALIIAAPLAFMLFFGKRVFKLKKKISPILLIGISAVLGIAVYGI